MPKVNVNGVTLHHELRGVAGDPLVLVHGSWVDHHQWDAVAEALSDRFRVLTFDRRGHGLSERPAAAGSRIDEDVDDVAALIGRLGLAPAHIAGNSFGACIVLRLAARNPGLFRSLIVHEPPLFALLATAPGMQGVMDDLQNRVGAVVALLEGGDTARAAERFVDDVVFGPGAWRELPVDLQNTFIANASTFLEETQEPEAFGCDLDALAVFRRPSLLTHGSQSPPFFAAMMGPLAAALPQARRATLAEAGHVPHWSHPARYASVVAEFILEHRGPATHA
jgi:pimeloyl-ACP methyl ester carboxylesterase